jgi:hypothetical protein
MSVVKTLQERIKELEKQRKELVQWRKNEIFEVINANGGICLDNRLLAGLAIYASMEENRNDAFLEKLKEIDSKATFPSRRKKPGAKSGNQNG